MIFYSQVRELLRLVKLLNLLQKNIHLDRSPPSSMPRQRPFPTQSPHSRYEWWQTRTSCDGATQVDQALCHPWKKNPRTELQPTVTGIIQDPLDGFDKSMERIKAFIVPGGRYLVSKLLRGIGVWDLGYTSSTHRPHSCCFFLVCSHCEMVDIFRKD